MTYRNRPVLVIILTAIAMVAAIAAVGVPLVWAAQLRGALANNANLIETLARASRGGSDTVGLATPEDPLIRADSAGRAGALLQLRLDELAAAHGVVIRSVQVLPPKREGEVTRITVAVTLQSVTATLRKFLHTLEASFPLVVIDEVSIRSLPTAPQDTASAMPLEVSLVVRGLAAFKEGP